MATGKITKRSVDVLAGASRGASFWDEELRGIGVKVTPAGTKTYLIQHRMAGRASKTQQTNIARHGTFTPAAARERAESLLRMVGSKFDPRIVNPHFGPH